MTSPLGARIISKFRIRVTSKHIEWMLQAKTNQHAIFQIRVGSSYSTRKIIFENGCCCWNDFTFRFLNLKKFITSIRIEFLWMNFRVLLFWMAFDSMSRHKLGKNIFSFRNQKTFPAPKITRFTQARLRPYQLIMRCLLLQQNCKFN